MELKAKITIEIPAYLKDWINAHDIGQNALVTLLLRKEYLSEKNASESKISNTIINYLENKKMPF